MMSNSSLVNYKRISPNRTSPRNHEIDTVTIHCVVGQVTVERLGEIFAPTSREASCNYGIGYDGKIGMYCEEKDRSWCSGGYKKVNGVKVPIRVNGISGSDNDHRAITIEVASDTTKPYKITDKAYASLVNLLADICKRNPKIGKLKWEGNKSLVGNISRQNMTVHRWFANKECPGDYLYNLHGQIAKEVNAKLETKVVTESVESNVVISNESLIYNWLKSNTTLSTAAICGILANLEAESAFLATNLQNSYEKKLGYTDMSYTSAVDSGKYNNFVRDSAGYGLCQWTYWSRKQKLLEYAQSKKSSIGDYTMQLEYLLTELKSSYKSVWSTLSKATDSESGAYNCGYSFCYNFEAPANKNTSSITRGNRAKELYKKYTTKSQESSSVDSKDFYDSIKVSDVLEFTGTKHYASANAKSGKSVKSSRAKVLKKYLKTAKHPIQVRAVDTEGKYVSGVYGWVDLNDLKTISSTSTTPYKVKVTAAALNYRSGPGTNYKVVGTIKNQGVYTIVQEKNDWGQLKSKAGWISLQYTKKI